MNVVVADTSPINYLILIDDIELLRKLYTRIVIPQEVFEELSANGSPPAVADWIRRRPDWMEVRSAPFDSAFTLADEYSGLDAGERAAIQLALDEPGSLLLIDEAAGRSAATRLGISNTGTLGVLLAAAHVEMVDLKAVLGKLRNTNFRISQSLIEKLLADSIQ